VHALAAPVGAGGDEEVSVEDLVQEALHQSDKKLRILKEADLKDALEEYVQKQQANAINELVANVLEDTQRKLNSAEHTRTLATAALIAEAVDDLGPTQSQSQAPRPAPAKRPDARPRQSAEGGSDDEPAAAGKKTASPKKAVKRARPSRPADDDEEEEEDEDEPHVRTLLHGTLG
jgi:hypothetical protein